VESNGAVTIGVDSHLMCCHSSSLACSSSRDNLENKQNDCFENKQMIVLFQDQALEPGIELRVENCDLQFYENQVSKTICKQCKQRIRPENPSKYLSCSDR